MRQWLSNIFRNMLRGMSHITLFHPVRHEILDYSLDGVETDREAIRRDWEMLGGDLRRAMAKLEAEMTPEQKEELKRIRKEREYERKE